jgi:hypothetical protein
MNTFSVCSLSHNRLSCILIGTPHKQYFFFVIVSVFAACKGVQESSKYHFNEGYYRVKSTQLSGKAYVVPNEDSVKVYPISRASFDSTKFIELALPQKASSITPGRNIFVSNSFDMMY